MGSLRTLGLKANARSNNRTRTGPTNRFPLAIYQPTSAKNVEVTLRFKPVAGKVDQADGIAVRVTSPDDYYFVRANALEDNVRFYRDREGPPRSNSPGANIKVAAERYGTR